MYRLFVVAVEVSVLTIPFFAVIVKLPLYGSSESVPNCASEIEHVAVDPAGRSAGRQLVTVVTSVVLVDTG